MTSPFTPIARPFLGRAFGRLLRGNFMSTVDDRHVITPAGRTEETLAWLEGRGYRAGLIAPSYEAAEYSMTGSPQGPFMGGTKLVGKAGVVFGRKNEPMIIAQIGDVLVYDGVDVVVE